MLLLLWLFLRACLGDAPQGALVLSCVNHIYRIPSAVVYMSTYALRSNEDNDFNSILQQLMARDMRQVAYGSMICRGPEWHCPTWWGELMVWKRTWHSCRSRLRRQKLKLEVFLCSNFYGEVEHDAVVLGIMLAKKACTPVLKRNEWAESRWFWCSFLSGPCPRGRRTLMAHQRWRIDSQWGRCLFLDHGKCTSGLTYWVPWFHDLVSWNLCQQDPDSFDLRRTLKMSEIRPCVADFPCKGTQKGLAHGLFKWSGNSREEATWIGTAAYACNSRVYSFSFK